MKIFLIDPVFNPVLWVFLFFSILIFFVYYAIVLRLFRIWISGRESGIDSDFSFDHHVTVIIAGRNEAKNLKACLDSVFANDFPAYRYDVIYVDDHSEDSSIEVLESVTADNFSFFQLADHPEFISGQSYKKSALKLGVKMAKGSLILLTDADTTVNKDWIEIHASQYASQDIKLCTGPVVYHNESGLLNQFQYFDLLATMGFTYGGITSGSYHLANGANMSFLKSAYDHGASRPDYASGDDMFLVSHVAAMSKKSVKFIQSEKAVVKTWPEADLKSFLRQRIRWGTKSKAYSNPKLKAIIAFVFLINMIVISDIIVSAAFMPGILVFIIIFIAVKFLIDIVFVRSVAKRYSQRINYYYLIVSLLIYPFYLVSAGLLSIFSSSYRWKGREVK